jgi:hypothetical protein
MTESGSKLKLKPGRSAIWLAVGALALGGGWYFFFAESTPLVQAAVAGSVAKTPSKKTTAATKPAASTQSSSVVAQVGQAPHRVSSSANNHLGPEYQDTTTGFSVRFPTDWRIRTFPGKTWILDCGDPSNGMISVGFSTCPRTLTVDHISPETIARRILRHPDTTLHSQGRAVIAGHEAIWSKFTGPLAMSNGSPRMTRVHYLIPLEDGRALELRAAAPPAKFEQIAPLMKASLETFVLQSGSR